MDERETSRSRNCSRGGWWFARGFLVADPCGAKAPQWSQSLKEMSASVRQEEKGVSWDLPAELPGRGGERRPLGPPLSSLNQGRAAGTGVDDYRASNSPNKTSCSAAAALSLAAAPATARRAGAAPATRRPPAAVRSREASAPCRSPRPTDGTLGRCFRLKGRRVSGVACRLYLGIQGSMVVPAAWRVGEFFRQRDATIFGPLVADLSIAILGRCRTRRPAGCRRAGAVRRPSGYRGRDRRRQRYGGGWVRSRDKRPSVRTWWRGFWGWLWTSEPGA
jgi:hypothetical protein